jgi:two-component system CheB/CheR fusion protein
MLVFAPQDMIKDPPFTKLDLICCRNLLIYLDADLQKKLLPLFHYALKPGGVLFLGASESIGDYADLFSVVDSKWKIYRQRPASIVRPALEFPFSDQRTWVADIASTHARVSMLAQKYLLQQFAPPSVITNSKGDVVFIHGRTGRYLEPAPGEGNWNIMEMAREGLRLQLPLLLRKAALHKTVVQRKNVKVALDGGTCNVNVTVRPLNEAKLPDLMLVLFEEVPADGPEPVRPGKRPIRRHEDREIDDLKQELQDTRESLQSMIEELETSNEELQSMNEEYQSTNEELKSANEELETSREELQSLNEELATVNTELQEKIGTLSQAHEDIQSLLDSMNIPTVFLDRKLQVKLFTRQAGDLLNLIDTDIGRPLAHLSPNLKDQGLVEAASSVLETMRLLEEPVEAKDGRWHLRRIAPYRGQQDRVDGVVISFVDIEKLRSAEMRSRAAQEATSTAERPGGEA